MAIDPRVVNIGAGLNQAAANYGMGLMNQGVTFDLSGKNGTLYKFLTDMQQGMKESEVRKQNDYIQSLLDDPDKLIDLRNRGLVHGGNWDEYYRKQLGDWSLFTSDKQSLKDTEGMLAKAKKTFEDKANDLVGKQADALSSNGNFSSSLESMLEAQGIGANALTGAEKIEALKEVEKQYLKNSDNSFLNHVLKKAEEYNKPYDVILLDPDVRASYNATLGNVTEGVDMSFDKHKERLEDYIKNNDITGLPAKAQEQRNIDFTENKRKMLELGTSFDSYKDMIIQHNTALGKNTEDAELAQAEKEYNKAAFNKLMNSKINGESFSDRMYKIIRGMTGDPTIDKNNARALVRLKRDIMLASGQIMSNQYTSSNPMVDFGNEVIKTLDAFSNVMNQSVNLGGLTIDDLSKITTGQKLSGVNLMSWNDLTDDSKKVDVDPKAQDLYYLIKDRIEKNAILKKQLDGAYVPEETKDKAIRIFTNNIAKSAGKSISELETSIKDKGLMETLWGKDANIKYKTEVDNFQTILGYFGHTGVFSDRNENSLDKMTQKVITPDTKKQ